MARRMSDRDAFREWQHQTWRKNRLRLFHGAATEKILERVTILFNDVILFKNPEHRVLVYEVYREVKKPIERYMRNLTSVEDWTLDEASFEKTLRSPKSPYSFVFQGKVMWVAESVPEPTMRLLKPPRKRKPATKHGKLTKAAHNS